MDANILSIEYQPHFLGFNREISITQDYICYGRVHETQKKILYDEITGFRCGIQWENLFYFIYVLRFSFSFQTNFKKTHTINFFTFYGFSKKRFSSIFEKVYNGLWEKIFERKFYEYWDRINNGETIKFKNIALGNHQITLSPNSQNPKKLFYKDIEIVEYKWHFTIIAKSDSKMHYSFDYLEDWNSRTVNRLIKNLQEIE